MNEKPVIQVKNLYKSFGEGRGKVEVLKGINLDIYQGEMVAIVGPSGAGKSTLLHILGTLERPSKGEVLLEGINPFSFDQKRLARFRNEKIGFIFQFHYLLSEFTAIENTMLPLFIGGEKRRGASKEAQKMLEFVGLFERLHHKPGELSGGEQQRVAVARAVILKPAIILADEPTGNLDTKTGEGLFELLQKLNQEDGRIVIVVTHNEGLAQRIPRRITLFDGKVIKDEN